MRRFELVSDFTPKGDQVQAIDRLASGLEAGERHQVLKGVTGSGALDIDAVEAMLPRIRQHVSVPVGVGFGIRDAQTARTIGQVADAVVIGTKIIQLIGEQARDQVAPVAQTFMREIRTALDS